MFKIELKQFVKKLTVGVFFKRTVHPHVAYMEKGGKASGGRKESENLLERETEREGIGERDVQSIPPGVRELLLPMTLLFL